MTNCDFFVGFRCSVKVRSGCPFRPNCLVLVLYWMSCILRARIPQPLAAHGSQRLVVLGRDGHGLEFPVCDEFLRSSLVITQRLPWSSEGGLLPHRTNGTCTTVLFSRRLRFRRFDVFALSWCLKTCRLKFRYGSGHIHVELVVLRDFLLVAPSLCQATSTPQLGMLTHPAPSPGRTWVHRGRETLLKTGSETTRPNNPFLSACCRTLLERYVFQRPRHSYHFGSCASHR